MSIISRIPEWVFIGSAILIPFVFWLAALAWGNFSDYPKRFVINNRKMKREIALRRFRWMQSGFVAFLLMFLLAFALAIIK